MRSGRGFVGPVIVVCAILAILVAADYWMNSGKIYRGVEVGSVPLGGKSPAEAEAVVRERATGALKEIELLGPEEFSFSAKEMGVNFDVDATVEEAYAVGRKGGIMERLSHRAKAAYGTVRIEPKVEYRRELAKKRVREVAASLNEKPREAAVSIVGPEVELDESREGYRIDEKRTMESVDAAVADMTGEARIVGGVLEPKVTTQAAEKAAGKARRAMDGQVVLRADGQYWTLSPADIGSVLDVETRGREVEVNLDRERLEDSLANVFTTLTTEPVEADYAVNGTRVSVSPGQEGKKVEKEKLLDGLAAGLFDGKREYQVPVVVSEPDFTTEEAEAMKPTDLLGEYDTNYLTYDDSPGRVKNLKIASSAVDGVLVAPGEVFSFNAHAEPLRDQYADTKVIIKGRVDTAEGGGLCQVSSTLYMAANLAGIDVTERHPHYAELPYIRPGFDATVWFGALDMQFRNDTEGYILVREWVDESTGNVHAQIWGRPNGTEVQMNSKKVATTRDDDDKPVTKWVTYQKVTRNGEVVYDGVLHEDTYKYLKPAEADEDLPESRPPN
jgi:vancomycin resistance protein YoaR